MIAASRLSRKILAGLAAGLLISSLIFLALFIETYRHELGQERANASDQVNRLFQVSLENAMLKRDLPGLQEIVDRLGQQPGIINVRIINPRREVRFSSETSALGTRMTFGEIGCASCTEGNIGSIEASAHTVALSDGREVLRGVHPIHNKTECKGCHGAAETSPVNGILVVDHDIAGIETQAVRAAALMSGAGLLVALMGMSTAWLVLRKQVLTPIMALDKASRELAAGDLKVRVSHEPRRDDELVDLAHSFNGMAAKIEKGVNEIREKEAFLKSLIETVPDGVRVIDENYTVVMANTAYARQAQTGNEALVGVPCYKVHGSSERCPPTLVTCPFHAIKADGEQIKYIHRHVKGDGSEFFVETSAARLSQTKDGVSRTYIIEAIRDLEQPVKYSQEQRLSEIGQLAAGVAHEIYNPLASVRLGLQALLRRAEEHFDPETSDYLNIVDGEVEKCIRVTKRLLDLSQVPSQSLQLVSLSAVVPEVLSLLHFEAEQSRIKLDIDLGKDDLRILATDSELRMLTLNLVQNAFHAMPDGGTLKIRGRCVDHQIVVDFTDTGVGITADVLPHIFDPFFSKRADGVSGTGLGLTICKAIATRYQGHVEVASTPQVGTTFTITFPQADANRITA